jgi:hypothetical protein
MFSQSQLGLGAPDRVRWCTGQCPVCQAGSGELAALGNELTAYGYNSPDCPVCTGLSGEPTVGRAIRARHVAEPTVERGHRTVWCAPDSVRWSTGQCPVRQAEEGKICLPGMLSTAPSCLGAIKGTPRRMEEYTKHPLSIPKH